MNLAQGPDIGGGFILLLALFVIPLVWARFDARRRGPRTGLVIWGTAAALVFLADAVRFLTSDSSGISDTGEALFLAVFLAAPLLAGGCFGALLGGATSRTQRP